MRLSLALLGLAAVLAQAADYRAGPQDYRAHLARLQAGDRLLLEPGDYERGLPLRDLAGEPGRPIVIEGPASGPPARFLARPGANTVSLVDVRHLVLRNLELDGRHLPVDAVKAEGHSRYAHFVTLENLYIHDHDASQQNVGISSKCPAFGWVVRGNRIERVGTGMYLGDSDGSDPFVGGLIEYNLIAHTLGYNLQIKHQRPRPDMGELPDYGGGTVIRHNVLSKAQGGSQGALARPNLLLGHPPPSGWGQDDRYLVYGNFFYENPHESLFQGEGNIALYDNLLVTRGPDAIRIQPHHDQPRDVRLLYNTVLAAGNGITVLAGTDNAFEQIVAGNAVFAARPIQGGVQRGNLTGSYDGAAKFLARPHAPLGEMDLAPRLGHRLPGAVQPSWLVGLIDAQLDFEGAARQEDLIGAYGRMERAGGWRPVVGFKPRPEEMLR